MNHDVEEHLRDALQRHADEAPPGAAMLSAVASESARRRRHRRLLTTSAAAVALAAVAVPLAFAPAPQPQVVSAPPPSAPGSTPGLPTSLIPSTAPTSLSFPFTPATRSGYGAPMISLSAGHLTLRQQLPDLTTATLTVSRSQPRPPSSKPATTPSKVRGHAATLIDWSFTDDDPQSTDLSPQRTLVWQESPTTWLELRTEPVAVPADRLIAYAEALQPQPLRAEVPFRFELTPAGFTIDNIDPTVTTFCPPGTTPDQGFAGKIAVLLSLTSDYPTSNPPTSDTAAPDPTTALVQVGTHPAWLTRSAETTTLQVSLGNNRLLVIQEAPTTALSDADLLRFAEAIAVTDFAQPGQG